MAWAKNGTPDTLTSSGDVMTISDLTAKKFNQVMFYVSQTGGDIRKHIFFNNNSNSVYAERTEENGGTDATVTSSVWHNVLSHAGNEFYIMYNVSISGEEKLSISDIVGQNTAGAANVPTRKNHVLKFVPSPDADITRIDCTNDNTGSYASDSNLSALGTD